MNSFKTLFRISLLPVLTLAITHPSGAQPMVSPVAVTVDQLGAELQQSFISAPPAVATATSASFIAYRKNFTLGTVPRSATLHLFADTRYILWINGKPVHRGPNRFETRGPQYDSLEIAPTLRPGSNTIAMVVMGNASNARMMKHAPALTLRIDVDKRTVVKTDETWKWNDQTRYRQARVNWASIIDQIDTTVEDGDWTSTDYDDKAWKTTVKVSGDSWGPLSARRIPLLRDTPVEAGLGNGITLPVTLTSGQQLKFTTPKMVQAYTMLAIEADEKSELILNYAGVNYTARPGRQIYISSDTAAFHGGAITVKSGSVKILGLKLMERLYPFDVMGSFKSNDEGLNRLWNVCARSCQLFSEDAYVDCADRERAEWMDCDPPAFDVTRTAMSTPGPNGKTIHGDGRLLGEMLRRTALTLQPEGWVKAHTCSDRFDIHAKMEDRACDWVQGARRYYDSTGDKTVIKEIWPVIVKQMNYFLERRTERGLVLAQEWVVWGNPVGYVTCEGAGLNAFVYKALTDSAHMGNAIGETQQAAAFAKNAEDLAQAYNKVLWDEKNGTYFSGYYSDEDQTKASGRAKGMKLKMENNLIEPTMFPALWALDQGLVPADRKARVTQYMMANRTQADRVMMFYYLWFQFYQQDTPALDREILDTMRKRWKGMADSGWQATWEEFSGGSRAHIYGMFPGYFLSAYVLGVRTDLPATNKRILIEPHLGDLTTAEGTVVTEFGPVPVKWEKEGDALRFRVVIPADTQAALRLPAGTLVVDGKRVATKPDGNRMTIEIGPGMHEGNVSLTDKP